MLASRARHTPYTGLYSTVICNSGREYQRRKVLMSNLRDKDHDIYLAYHKNKPYVLKRVSQSIFKLCLQHKREFPNTHRIRLHIDHNEKENIVIYEYFKEDLLSLIKNNPNLPLQARKKIIFEAAKALQELHAKNWIHIDVKPDNIMVNWNLNEAGQIQIERVALIDLDVSLKLKGGKLLRIPTMQRLGNFMWRSPEAQTGQGIGKSADVFSFGLVCIYTLTGREIMAVDYQELEEREVEPEIKVLGRCIVYFGPLCKGLLEHTFHETWEVVLGQVADGVAGADPCFHLSNWKEDGFPNIDDGAKRMLGRIMNLDPVKRVSMHEILDDVYWR